MRWSQTLPCLRRQLTAGLQRDSWNHRMLPKVINHVKVWLVCMHLALWRNLSMDGRRWFPMVMVLMEKEDVQRIFETDHLKNFSVNLARRTLTSTRTQGMTSTRGIKKCPDLRQVEDRCLHAWHVAILHMSKISVVCGFAAHAGRWDLRTQVDLRNMRPPQVLGCICHILLLIQELQIHLRGHLVQHPMKAVPRQDRGGGEGMVDHRQMMAYQMKNKLRAKDWRMTHQLNPVWWMEMEVNYQMFQDMMMGSLVEISGRWQLVVGPRMSRCWNYFGDLLDKMVTPTLSLGLLWKALVLASSFVEELHHRRQYGAIRATMSEPMRNMKERWECGNFRWSSTWVQQRPVWPSIQASKERQSNNSSL